MNIFKILKYNKRLKIIEHDLERLRIFIEDTAKAIYNISYQPNMMLFNMEIQHMLPEYLQRLKEIYPAFLYTYKTSSTDLFGGNCSLATKINQIQYYLKITEKFHFCYRANFLKGYRITKLNGEVFECSYDDIDELGLNGTTVTWKNKVAELFSKIEPVFEETDRDFKWQWKDKNGINGFELFNKQVYNIEQEFHNLVKEEYEIKQLLNK